MIAANFSAAGRAFASVYMDSFRSSRLGARGLFLARPHDHERRFHGSSRYRLVVLDGADHRVLSAGGVFPHAVSAVLQGASNGGGLVKIGWIGVGLRMELIAEGKRIVTSPVRSIVRVKNDGVAKLSLSGSLTQLGIDGAEAIR